MANLSNINNKFLVTTGGNVGIGTTSPNSKLDVTGGDITVNTTGTGFINFKYSGNSIGSIQTDGLDIKINATSDLVLLPGSNVGIGTTSPAQKLHVETTASSTARFAYNGSNYQDLNWEGSNIVGGSHVFKIAGSEKMRITSSAEGHVELSGTAPVIKATASNGGSGLRINIAGQTSGQLFRVQEDGTTKFQINENGNVGINDTSPDFKLDVEGTFGVSDLPFNSSSVSVLVADETLGPELSVLPSAVSGVGDFYAFVQYGNNTIAYTAGTTETVITYVDNSSGAYQYLNTAYNLSSNLVIGSNYKVAITFKVNTGTFTWQVHNGATTTSLSASSNTSFETIEYINTPTHATNSFIRASDMGAGQIVTVSKVSVKQVTSASNQIQKSELNNIPRTNPAASLYDLIPNGAFTTTYAFTSTAGTYAEVMSGDDVITETGTYSVQMIVNDFAVGGTQYDEKYSGVMSWHATSTNDSGIGAISEIALHRAGHAGNQGITYLRTQETTSAADPGPNELKLEIMCNRTYSGASNIIFKFVRLI